MRITPRPSITKPKKYKQKGASPGNAPHFPHGLPGAPMTTELQQGYETSREKAQKNTKPEQECPQAFGAIRSAGKGKSGLWGERASYSP